MARAGGRDYHRPVPTEALTCPNCRAPGPTGPDAKDEYLCIYCGTRFHRTAQAQAPVVVSATSGPSPAPKGNAGPVLLAFGLATLIAVAAAALVFGSGDDSSDRGPEPRPAEAVAPVSADPSSVAAPTSVSAPAVVQAPEPEVAASGTFDFHRILPSVGSTFYALGTVTNTSPFVIGQPKVIAVLLDEQGQEIATDFGYAERDVLGPDQSSPIKVLVKDPPAHASVRYELVVKKASYIPATVEGLRVEAMTPRTSAYDKKRWEVEGKVFNEGSEAAKFVEIEIQAIDGEGKLVGVGNTFADGDVLAAGSNARWSTSVAVADVVDHFEFAVSGRPAN